MPVALLQTVRFAVSCVRTPGAANIGRMSTDNQNPGNDGRSSGRPFVPLQPARQLLGEKRYREAHAYCRNALEQDPDCADAFFVLGIINYEHNQFERALKLFERALEKGHPEPGAHVQAARCYAKLTLPKQALIHIEAAIKLQPSDGFTLASIGATLSALDRHEEAVAFHRQAATASSNDPIVFFNLGSSLQFIGDFEGARKAYRTCLQFAPQYIPARAYLALITKHSPEQNAVAELEAAWLQRHPRDIEGGLQLAHAIAKVHEDLADPAAAMDWLDKGKALVRQNIPSQRMQNQASFEAAEALCHTLGVNSEVQTGGPIFIVGLPRTGTTLVDRIISSHSGIVSAGERPEFGAFLKRAVGNDSADMLGAGTIKGAAGTDLLAVGQNYIESVQGILNGAQRFTDKMPINALLVPAILAALPNARVICLRRQPADSVLSIYRQLFALSALHYRCAHSLEDLADYVARFHGLVETYTGALPSSRFTLVDYETLVEEPEAETRRLLEFCGLDFEQACLDFQENTAPVATASVAQVRQPMYRSSVDRWKRYQPQLEPALEILRKAGRL